MERTRIQLADGVYLTYLPARKFKTSLLSAQFVTPLQQETASAYALLPAVLRRGTVRYPGPGGAVRPAGPAVRCLCGLHRPQAGRESVRGLCGQLYRRQLHPRWGDSCWSRWRSCWESCCAIPVTERGRFVTAYFEREKTNLIDAIRSQVNDKREYAYARLLQEMCAGEPYGISRLGDEAGAEKLQMPKLHALYGELLCHRPAGAVLHAAAHPWSGCGRPWPPLSPRCPGTASGTSPPSAPHPARTEVKRVEEAMDVTQGKLGMGFACGSDDYAAVLMGNTLFGGSSNSKLFLNVREKLSLCYYASSAYHRQKRLITVSSGIEFQNYQKAYDEIMAQLAAVQAGRLEDWELEGARSTLLNAYASMGDSQGKLENFYLGQAATGQEDTPELLAEQVRDVTAERIFDAMETVSLDTVYFLKGKEAAE